MASLSALGGGLIGYVVPFLFVLTIVVFFHELGHFLMARLCGIKVVVFSIGFGPEIVGFYDRYGTRWKISAVPLGGYVKFLGDENVASTPDAEAIAKMSEADRRGSFHHKTIGARSAVIAAGPIANFIVAVVIFAGLAMAFGKPSTLARVDTVQEGSAAEEAGFKPGDIVLSINGRRIDSFTEMQRIVSLSAGEKLTIVVRRGDQEVTLTAVPRLQEVKDPFNEVSRRGILGISRSPDPTERLYEPVSPIGAVSWGVAETWFVIEG